MSTRTNAPSESISSTLDRPAGGEGTVSEELPSRTPVSPYVVRTAATIDRELRRVAFWIAVLLPLAYVSAFAAGVAKSHPLAFGGLVLLNAVAVVVGHPHNRPDRP